MEIEQLTGHLEVDYERQTNANGNKGWILNKNRLKWSNQWSTVGIGVSPSNVPDIEGTKITCLKE